MAIRDISPAEYNEEFDNIPAYFSQKHGQLAVRGLGSFAEDDMDQELVENYQPFIPELAGLGRTMTVRVITTQRPPELRETFLRDGITRYFPLGGVIFEHDGYYSDVYWVGVEDQVVVAPSPEFDAVLTCPSPGVVFDVQVLWPEPPPP